MSCDDSYAATPYRAPVEEAPSHRDHPVGAWSNGSSVVFRMGNGDLEFTVFSLSLFVSGLLLRKRRKAGGVLAIAAFGMTGIAQLATGAVLTVEFAITVVIVLLVLAVWRELR